MEKTNKAYLNKPVKKEAVITVPAYFNDSQRKATRDAGAIAGLDVIRIINEPTAAAIAYGLDKKSEISGTTNVLVFDLGGGTFDVSLVTIKEGNTFEVQAVAGDTHLGGEDFDNRMVSDCVKEFKKKFNKDLTGSQKALGRLRVACEKAKKELSYVVDTSIELDGLLGEDFSMIFRRAKFDKLNMASFNKCIETVERCLSDANMEKSSVNEVILVGGSTRIPMIRKMLREFFDGRDLSVSVNPDEAVACGAAILAAKLSGSSDKSDQDLVRADVTPLSLGVAVRRDVFDVVIPRKTRNLRKKSKIYLTTEDNQLETCIEVYQGERIKCKDNHLLGKFLFSGIPPAPRGKIEFEDSFEIDADGILTVTSKILTTGKTKKITITSEKGRLSKEEIEKMIKDVDVQI
ncbi:putative heat shock protein 70 family protein [Tanacetum coccineum]